MLSVTLLPCIAKFVLLFPDNGASWADPRIPFSPSYNFVGLDFAVDSAGNINLIWGDYDYSLDNWEIYFSRSIDSGVNWINGVNISDSTGDAESLAIAVDSAGNIHVVFEDDTSGTDDIYYTGSTK